MDVDSLDPLPMQQRTLSVLSQLLAQCHANAIVLVQVRYRPLTHEVAYDGGDYDFLLAKKQHKQFFTLAFNVLAAAGIPFLIDQRKPGKTVLQIYDVETCCIIRLEIWSFLELHDPARRATSRIWPEDLHNVIRQENGGYALAPQFEALYYLAHLYTKKKQLQAAEVQKRLKHYRQLITQNNDVAQLYEQLQEQGDLKQVATEACARLLALNIARPRTTHGLRCLLETTTSRWLRFWRRRAAGRNIIAFTGPDGVGKTTIIREYKQLLDGRVRYYRFKKLFRGALLYQVLYPALKWTAQHANPACTEKNQVDDTHGLLLFFIARTRYFTLSLRRLWHTLLLTDRYFYDFLVSGARYQDATLQPRRHLKTLLRLTPAPRCLVQLDASNEVIHARKAELSTSAIDFLRQFTFQCYWSKPAPFYLYLNTGLPLDACISALRQLSGNIGMRFHDFDLQQTANNGADALLLSDAIIIGSGHERLCLQHPTDVTRCIKVSRLREGGRQQNRIDASYFSSLSRRGVPFDHLPHCHGWVSTVHGRGLMFDRITGPTGGTALTLDRALRDGHVDCTATAKLLDELYAYLDANALVFSDASLSNLVVGQTPEGALRLYVIDGLGARQYGLKLWLHERVLWLARRKLHKQWQAIQRQWRDACTTTAH